MDKLLKYSVLKYVPSYTQSEQFVLGILFHDEELDYRKFQFRQDISHLLQLDSELDIELVKKLLHGIKEEVESESPAKPFDIEDFTRFYLNAFRFTETKTIKYDVLEETIESVAHSYLGLDSTES